MNLNSTIDYYNQNSKEFINNTINLNLSDLYKRFETYLKPGDKILDLGCGSGRDSRYFKKKGYDVMAVDPSEKMCEYTRNIANIPVLQMKAEEINFDNQFNGIWACASLLHVSNIDLYGVLVNLEKALKYNGILYASWKIGESERNEEGRFFNDFTEERLHEYLYRIKSTYLLEVWKSSDVSLNRENIEWINAIIQKKV